MTNIVSEFEPTEDDLKLIRNWLVKTPHMVSDYDDQIIRTIIRSCKGSLEKTKKCYEKINSLGYVYPHMFGHLDPLNEITQYFLDHSYFFRMPKRADDGSIILVAKPREDEVDSNKFSVMEIARYMYMSFWILLWENEMEDNKFIFIFDCQNIKLSEMKTVTPTFLKEFLHFLNSLPIRYQGSHHINVPRYFQPIINFMMSMMKSKIVKRLKFHASLEELHELIPKKCLPKEFGGHGDDLITLHNWWRKKVESYRDRLILENNKMRKLDHFRPRFNSYGEELQGSFRKLTVD